MPNMFFFETGIVSADVPYAQCPLHLCIQHGTEISSSSCIKCFAELR